MIGKTWNKKKAVKDNLYNNCVVAKLGTACTGKFINLYLELLRMRGSYWEIERERASGIAFVQHFQIKQNFRVAKKLLNL
jgi:hypothetical protein